jgi:hypothetical protein
MIQVYDQTWQFYLRMMQYTARRRDFMPYCTLHSIDSFMQQVQDSHALDWGCGENNHKLVYNTPAMLGIDRTPEADIYGYPDQVWSVIPRSDRILAINSVHFNKSVYDAVARIMDEKLNVGGTMFFTVNDTGHSKARLWANPDLWAELGTVEYYWHIDDHRAQMEQDLKTHLYDDQIARLNSSAASLIDMYTRVVQQTITHDPFHGLLRVQIRK